MGVGVVSNCIAVCYFPIPFIPSRQGRGIFTFYEAPSLARFNEGAGDRREQGR